MARGGSTLCFLSVIHPTNCRLMRDAPRAIFKVSASAAEICRGFVATLRNYVHGRGIGERESATVNTEIR